MALTPQRLPEVLSRAEVAAVLAAPMSIKARTFLMTAYAAGMHVSELCNLCGCDIDSRPIACASASLPARVGTTATAC